MDRAEHMKKAVLALEKQLARSPAHFIHMEQWQGYKDGVQDYAAAIRDLPLPPNPSLDADIAELLPFLRTAESATREQLVRTAIWTADLIERLAGELADAEAAIDSIETSHGLTDHGNLWRWWREKGRESLAKRNEAIARAEKSEAEVARLREALGNVADSLERTHREVLAMKPANAQWSGDNIYRAFGHLMGGLSVAASLAHAAIRARGQG